MHFLVLNCIEFSAWKDLLTVFLSATALIISIRTFILNRRLNIKQNILKTALDKAKDCNEVWNKEKVENSVSIYKAQYNIPYNNTISELVISKELVEISYALFDASNKDKQKYVTAFWKQLRTDLRGFYVSDSFIIAKNLNESANPKHKTTYCKQVLGIYEFISIGDLENPPDISLIEELKKYEELKELG